ncbi:MAG: ribosome-associated translation inhibitor RaiA [Burkholderiales bacterium]|jgi:putative sigma-54 modulation protein|uniref:Ribosome hibernation promoting factor n=1 Tax=Janthinobacterium tructae TaxID=2590869 RepID=A0A4Y6RJE1_9BURK|nr:MULTISPECIES: ribosome-associated translation inhibitor RaiA [Janthinobacterium]MBH1980966.1 ribosome-associated translation inhibitor RaiA [Burkholderiales bacterium]MBH1995815.1 ribosome-associated translation inhibitor RaiA [Burkholderiales bacterium]MBH2068007.1 ribosome-associated translation inhibitor RaiA [Burkholderiales bacterium]MDI3295187.1 ribosome-associated translation inhibitor RaiA [Janthinobacterium tructae]QDG72564.1 ribosome-associated translation inhibitor RaiA [Janthino
MNLTISGHHLEVTPAIREYVQTKLERVKRHFDQVIDIAVILTVDNLKEKEKRQKAEVNLRLSGKTVYVESLAHDLYAAIDILIDKLDRQVMKYKTKVQGHGKEAIKHLPDNSEEDAVVAV